MEYAYRPIVSDQSPQVSVWQWPYTQPLLFGLNVAVSKLIDPFLGILVATVVLASLVPARGAAATGVDALATAAIVLLFFCTERASRARICWRRWRTGDCT
jgi:hypothetical protein